MSLDGFSLCSDTGSARMNLDIGRTVSEYVVMHGDMNILILVVAGDQHSTMVKTVSITRNLHADLSLKVEREHHCQCTYILDGDGGVSVKLVAVGK